MIVMPVLLEEGSKWTDLQILPVHSNFGGSIRMFDFQRNSVEHDSVEK